MDQFGGLIPVAERFGRHCTPPLSSIPARDIKRAKRQVANGRTKDDEHGEHIIIILLFWVTLEFGKAERVARRPTSGQFDI